MKRLLILSGKGGTGKTTVAGAFIRLSQARAYADCDVDASNLHLVIKQDTIPKEQPYFGLDTMVIDDELCTDCGACSNLCAFDAIEFDESHRVNPYLCEGCGLCEAVCPVAAIKSEPRIAGTLSLFRGVQEVFSTARLDIGSGTSGKLVSEVKKRLDEAAPNAPLAIIDGSPGIGCPVIASLSGVDMVLIVAEASLSSVCDTERILQTARIFDIRSVVCVNKSDINEEKSKEIEDWCRNNGIAFVGKIPFDPKVIEAVNVGITIVETPCAAGEAVKEIYRKTMCLLSIDG
jgi:MinD superfamily P-loop ATPase